MAFILTSPPSFFVNLNYFKTSGKFYGKGSYEVTTDKPLYKIWDQVVTLRDTGRLPGLGIGASNYNILIEVPEHPDNHPYFLMLPGANPLESTEDGLDAPYLTVPESLIDSWIRCNPVEKPGSTGGPAVRLGTYWYAVVNAAARWGAAQGYAKANT